MIKTRNDNLIPEKGGEQMNIDNNKLNLAIAKSCMTMKNLANISGVNVTTLSRINTGKQAPSLRTIGKIAKALNLDVEDLIEE
jgi:DNA-binding XRE family transcriptional regulator